MAPEGALRAGLTREQARSLWLHAAVAAMLVEDPDRVMATARANLDRLDGQHHGAVSRSWLDQWRRVLDDGAPALLAVLRGTTERDADLRQNSPFAGVLSQTERRTQLEAFTRDWAVQCDRE